MREKTTKSLSALTLASLLLLSGCGTPGGEKATTKETPGQVTPASLEVTQSDIDKGIYVKFAPDSELMKVLGFTKEEVAKFKESVNTSAKKAYKVAEKENAKAANRTLPLIDTLQPYIHTEELNTANKRKAVQEVSENDAWDIFGKQFILSLLQLEENAGVSEVPSMATEFEKTMKGHKLAQNSFVKAYAREVDRLEGVKNQKDFQDVLRSLEGYINTVAEVNYFGYLMPGNFYADYVLMKYQELNFANRGDSISSLLDEDSFYNALQGKSTQEKKAFIQDGRKLVAIEMKRKYETKSFQQLNEKRLNLVLSIYDAIEDHNYSVSDKTKGDYHEKLNQLSTVHNEIEKTVKQLGKS